MIEDEFKERFTENNFRLRKFLVNLGVQMDYLDDLCGEAWLRAWHGRGHFRGDCSFSSWFMTVGRNVYFEMLRRPKFRRTDQLPEGFDERVAAGPLPDMQLEMKTFLNDTPVILRQRYYEGMTPQEIAATHGITPQCVKIRVFRAKHKMREQIARRTR